MSASFRAPSTLQSIPITAVIGLTGLGASSAIASSGSPLAPGSTFSASTAIPSMSKYACLARLSSSTLSLILSPFTISESNRSSQSGKYGTSSVPLPHCPVPIPSSSHNASPRRKLSVSAVIARAKLLEHSPRAPSDVLRPARLLRLLHSHFTGSQVIFCKMQLSACTHIYQSRKLL